MRPIWLNHLQDKVVVLAINVQEQFFLLERLRAWVSTEWSRPLLLISIELALVAPFFYSLSVLLDLSLIKLGRLVW